MKISHKIQKGERKQIKMKICSKCGRKYPASLEYFAARKDSRDGLLGCCRHCYNKRLREYYKNNKEKIFKIYKKYKNKNKKKIKDINKKYRQDHKMEISIYKKKYALEHKEEMRKRNRKYQHSKSRKKYLQKYYKKNREKLKIRRYEYCCKHRKERKEYGQKYRLEHRKERNKSIRERRKIDIEYRIVSNLRTRLSYVIRAYNIEKTNHTLELIGCTTTKLMKFLESKFLPQMTWDNYGRGDNKWNIDHIIPIAFFDMRDTKQQQKCFHYSNLQPLWQPDNCKKLSYYNGKLIKKGGSYG